jgi:uncharacterized surface protein with fasciclin (FAS1) repeats
VVAGVALTAAACGSSSKTATPPSTTAGPAAVVAAFGSDCAMIPASGVGSLHSMSMEPVLQAAAHNPLLTTFAADATTAGLASELDTMHGITVFAPANDAFAHLPVAETSMMRSGAELAKILKYHVVDGHITPTEFQAGMTPKTLEGDTVELSKMGAVYEVNKADVICGNIQTANATIYILNAVLTPMH